MERYQSGRMGRTRHRLWRGAAPRQNASNNKYGEVAERLKARLSKSRILARVSRVRIPPSPIKNRDLFPVFLLFCYNNFREMGDTNINPNLEVLS
jgi:hypothetical protein